MKFLAVFAAILVLTAGVPVRSEWTLGEITAALANPSTDPTMVPYLEHALNQIMDALHAGFQIDAVAIPLPAEISPAPATSEWTLGEITAALADPSTDPTMVPYLEHALNQIMDALHAGFQIDAVAIPLPAEISPAPAGVEEAVIDPTPVVVADSPAAPVSPLVQIIVNVNNKDQAAVVPAPVPSPAVVPEIVPTPVAVVDSINPTPVVVVDEAIEPTPVVVVEEPAEIPVNPIDVIEVLPAPAPAPVDVNPIDVIAVGAPEVNPVDIMNPIPVNPAAEAGAIWV